MPRVAKSAPASIVTWGIVNPEMVYLCMFFHISVQYIISCFVPITTFPSGRTQGGYFGMILFGVSPHSGYRIRCEHPEYRYSEKAAQGEKDHRRDSLRGDGNPYDYRRENETRVPS